MTRASCRSYGVDSLGSIVMESGELGGGTKIRCSLGWYQGIATPGRKKLRDDQDSVLSSRDETTIAPLRIEWRMEFAAKSDKSDKLLVLIRAYESAVFKVLNHCLDRVSSKVL